MWNESPSPMFLAVVAGSILAHVAVLALLPPSEAAAHDKLAPKAVVSFETAPLPPPPPPPAPEPLPVAKELPPTTTARPVARSPRPVAKRIAASAAPKPTTAPPPTAAEPADFSGMTLTNEGAGWSTPTGDGSPMTGPITAAPAAQEVAKAPRTTSGGGTGDRVVAVGDLSRPPKAPNLDAQLAANYPADARAAGLSGTAVIRARILVDGRVGTTRIVSESAPGFGKACQRTLAGSKWQPPLDANQQPVATDLAYTCTFAVAR